MKTAYQFLFMSLILLAVPLQAEPSRLTEHFDNSSCLRRTYAAGWLTQQGELVLKLNGHGGQAIQTKTELGYGYYTARVKTDLGAGAIFAFYLMGIDSSLRNVPAYYYLHDEVDIELVGSLWREGQHMANNAMWINAYHNHESIILPLYKGDTAGGSLFAMGDKRSDDNALFHRQILSDMDSSTYERGHNFNDGRYYVYAIEYTDQQITYSVMTDDGKVIKSYTLTRHGGAWPQTKMYLALSLWTPNDEPTRSNFAGYMDWNFGRPMSATIDYVTYQPYGNAYAGAASANGRMPWSICP